jgi:hypothetical protein
MTFTFETDTIAFATEEFDAAPTPPAQGGGNAAVSHDLRTSSAAIRVSFTWLGTRKALTPQQRDEIATGFNAEVNFISAGKKLLDTKHPAFRAVTAVRTEALTYWRDNSLPFPEPGIRLIPRDQIETFTERLTDFREKLDAAVIELENHYYSMQNEARRQLGNLFNPADYPPTLAGLFAIGWDFPNVEPPDYLMRLHPDVYETERARVASQFDQAVALAEQAFIEQFNSVITHLCERLEKGDDGQPKVFRDSAVNNVKDFFDRFKSLSVRSNDQLDALVTQAQDALRGVNPTRLRANPATRETVAENLKKVEETLSGMLVDRPRRRIVRPTNPTQETES